MLSQFALCGAAVIAWVFLPESPRWHCVGGREEETKKILLKVNGKVEGYDVDMEYRRMRVEVQHASEKASLHSGGSYLEVFRGTNRVRELTVRYTSGLLILSCSADSSSPSCHGIGRLPLVSPSSLRTPVTFMTWPVWPTPSTAL